MMRVETSPKTTVSKMVEPIPKQRLAVMSIERPGSTRAMASLVISVSTASMGAMRMFTPKPAADAGEGRRHAGQRMSPDAEECGRTQRDEHEVAGVGGDAGYHADEHDDVGERADATRRPRACG